MTAQTRKHLTDDDRLNALATIPADTRHAATLTICSHARDTAEAREVLAMVGLIGNETR